MSAKVSVGQITEFPVGEFTLRVVNGLSIGILRWSDGRIFAIHNRCPHMSGPVCGGTVGPKLECAPGAPGDLVVDESAPIVACPWHRWEFYAATGEAAWDPKYRLRTFAVEVDGDNVVLGFKGGRSGDQAASEAVEDREDVVG